MTQPTRCPWVGDDALMRSYHDDEWGVPEHNSRALWEMLMLECFQAGLSWRTILHKRSAFQAAFAGFEPQTVARFTTADIENLMQNSSIVRSRAKILATIGNAQAYLDMQQAGEDLATWVWEFSGGETMKNNGPVPSKTPLSEKLSTALKKRGFKFTGPVTVYSWMQSAGIANDHTPECFRRAALD